jgi:hypothetical protein
MTMQLGDKQTIMTVQLGDKQTIRNVEVTWNGFGITFSGGMYFVPLLTSDEATIRGALAGWHYGFIHGKNTGRSMLQNEFRNLMDCQK